MRKAFFFKLFLLLALLVGSLGAGRAQNNDAEAEKSWVLAFIESQISTPNRQIRLHDIEGTLSSQASIGEITIADTKGIWLRIIQAKIDWNRGRLLLGHLSINELSAARIEILRQPLPDSDKLPEPQAQIFSLPQLPVAVEIGAFSSPLLVLGEELIGRASRLSLDGNATLADGNLAAYFRMSELDNQGRLSLIVDYKTEDNRLKLDLELSEPENGILANLLAFEGLPEVHLRAFGDGVLDALDITLAANVGGQSLANGLIFVEKQPQGHAFGFELAARLASILPKEYHAFFGDETRLAFVGHLSTQTGLQIDDFVFRGGENVFLEGQGGVDRHGLLRQLIVNGQLMADKSGIDLILPIKGAETQLEKLELAITYDPTNSPASTDPIGRLKIGNFASPHLRAKDVQIDFYQSGLRGFVTGLNTGNPVLDRYLTEEDRIELNALLEKPGVDAGKTVAFDIKSQAFSLSGVGLLQGGLFDGNVKLKIQDSTALTAEGQLDFLAGAFDLALAGTMRDLQFDQPLIDRLLMQEIHLSGKIKRDEQGMHFDALEIGNDSLKLRAEGNFSNIQADLDVGLEVADLVSLDPRLQGGLQVKAAARGHSGFILLAARGEVATGHVSGQRLEQAQIHFHGFLDKSRPYQSNLGGQIDAAARFDGQDLVLSTDFSLIDGVKRFDNFLLTQGKARIAGTVDVHKDGLLSGFLEASQLQWSHYQIERLSLESRWQDGKSHIEMRATSRDYGAFEAQLLWTTHAPSGWEWTWQQARWHQGLLDIELETPTRWVLTDYGALFLDTTRLQMAGSHLSVSGSIADEMMLDVQIGSLPLDLVDLVAPSWQSRGEVNGHLAVRGAVTLPQLSFDLIATEMNMAFLENQGLAALTLHISGSGNHDFVDLKANLTGANTLEANMQGRIRFETRELNLAVELDNLPLANLAGLLKTPNLDGRVTGNGHIRGQISKPQLDFALEAVNISSHLLAENGLAPLTGQLVGRFDSTIVTLERLTASGPQGLHFTAFGQLPLFGNGLNLQGQGDIPLGLANRFLAKRGAQLAGLLTLEANVTGSIQKPQLDGHFAVAQGQFMDPPSNARLNDMVLSGTLAGDQVTVTQMQAHSGNGGLLRGQGTISTDIAQGLPAAITLQLDHMRYNDGAMVAATLDGEISITGSLLRDFELGGRLLVEQTDINVPNLTNQAQEIEVRHKNISKTIATTLARAQIEARTRSQIPSLQRNISPRFNLEISAPARIFVRGRGLDSELGGAIRLTGSFDAPQPVGSFSLIRGRFDILTKRLILQEGRISLSGTLDPELYFMAHTQGNGLDVSVILRGTLDELSLVFASQPPLPQDEVLAFLIFNRSLAELSPLQVAQLVTSAAELAGMTGSSLMSRLRGVTGLDELDVTSDAQGNTGVRAGRYIRDNVYLGVEADNQGQTKGSINLDITRDLKAKGTISSDANSSLGIFYEKDY